MKKMLPVVLFLLVAAVAFYVVGQRGRDPSSGSSAATNSGGSAAGPQTPSTGASAGSEGVKPAGLAPSDDEPDLEDLDEDKERPAAEIYKSAEEALAAIKQGALSYDDLILEQFTTPGENCGWCDQFYVSLKDMLLNPEVNQDQRSYFAEVLAVSGRVDNIRTLVDAIKAAPNQEAADSLAEALELTIGRDDVVNYLAEQIRSDNSTIKEASIAAVTNQGSRLAVDTLYKHTVERNDPDGYYSLGIGLGELVPEEEALPRLQEIMLKRDTFSHLAVKSLLNQGPEGLKLVLDALSSSKDPAADKELLKDAVDHVAWDEETEALIEKTITAGKGGVAEEFAKQVKEELKAAEDAENVEMTPPSDNPPAQ
jgi:hypothetical protein